jgi:hypothetical protein
VSVEMLLARPNDSGNTSPWGEWLPERLFPSSHRAGGEGRRECRAFIPEILAVLAILSAVPEAGARLLDHRPSIGEQFPKQ